MADTAPGARRAASTAVRPPVSIASVQRCLAILGLLAGDREGLRLAEVASALGADRANAMRILAVMEDNGFVLRDAVSDRYRLTFRVISLGLRHLEVAGMEQWAQPILDQLASESQEMVRLTVVEPGGLRWIARAQGASSRVILDPVQRREVPLHATAAGKAWLASLPEDDAIQLVLRQGFQPQTPRTIRTVDALRSELRIVRERGYGTADEEADLGILSVAVTVCSAGRPVGTVSVAAPTLRATIASLERYLPQLRRAAALLGETWGPYVAGLIPSALTQSGNSVVK